MPIPPKACSNEHRESDQRRRTRRRPARLARAPASGAPGRAARSRSRARRSPRAASAFIAGSSASTCFSSGRVGCPAEQHERTDRRDHPAAGPRDASGGRAERRIRAGHLLPGGAIVGALRARSAVGGAGRRCREGAPRCRRSRRRAGRPRAPRRPASSTDSRTRAPAPIAAPGADHQRAVEPRPVADRRALAEQHGAARARRRRRGPPRRPSSSSPAGSTSTAPGEHVEVALQVLGQRADVVPVGVGDVDAERDVARRAAPGRRRGRSRPPRWSGKWSKISGSST